jgi:hypothetical protein
MLLAGIYISALHIWCGEAELTIGQAFHDVRKFGIVLATGGVAILAFVLSRLLETEVLADWAHKLGILEIRHFSTTDRYTFFFVVLLKLSIRQTPHTEGLSTRGVSTDTIAITACHFGYLWKVHWAFVSRSGI